ncbi:hypothetical protein [Wocania ichthyoenteri]|uniref:hypothetical protein n=1 Tax=Wocania ichthyoenteri TaxID=1230531 RepID=UPI00053CFE3F|nr:hypothetical protein [Wocania ichthyoenteri]
MKNFTKILWVFLLITGNIFGQQEKGITGTDNWLHNWTEFKPNTVDYGEPTQILAGNITKDTKLSKRNIYLLSGNVFVTDSTTLTIEPGTVIIGDYESKASLTISKGSKIIAEGLETDPIIFTSNRSVKRAGDWGGIIILGDAPTTKFGSGSVASFYGKLNATIFENSNYGGENLASNSGVLKYVRIEYAGKRIKNAGYFNGLLLASVGNETILENIMVSHCAGNSFEILGGEVYLNKVVSYKANSNDFKFNYGTQSSLSNSLAIRSPYVSSRNGARCLQINSYDNKDEVDFTKKGTLVVAKNITLITDSDNLKSDIQQGLVKEAVYVGHNASLEMIKSVISGFNPAVLFEDKIRVNQENLEKIKFTDMYFNNCNGNIFVENNMNNEDLENWYGNSAFFNVYSKSNNSETFIDLKNQRKPDYRLRINKIIASNEVDPDLKRLDD